MRRLVLWGIVATVLAVSSSIAGLDYYPTNVLGTWKQCLSYTASVVWTNNVDFTAELYRWRVSVRADGNSGYGYTVNTIRSTNFNYHLQLLSTWGSGKENQIAEYNGNQYEVITNTSDYYEYCSWRWDCVGYYLKCTNDCAGVGGGTNLTACTNEAVSMGEHLFSTNDLGYAVASNLVDAVNLQTEAIRDTRLIVCWIMGLMLCGIVAMVWPTK